MIANEEVLRILFPQWLFEDFQVIDYKNNDRLERIDLYLDERKIYPDRLDESHTISHGFTERVTIQDFPIRGKAVYLHLRRRKWLDKATGQIVSRQLDVTHYGTRITKEFVAFLKEACRE